jgi:hypothetical protein
VLFSAVGIYRHVLLRHKVPVFFPDRPIATVKKKSLGNHGQGNLPPWLIFDLVFLMISLSAFVAAIAFLSL